MLSRVKHHFINSLSINDEYNVARFEEEALNTISEIHKEHDIAVMAGGSGLYIDAVCYGIDEFPDADPVIRERIKRKYKEQGLDYIRNWLKELDPFYFEQVDLDNPNRIRRAIEVSLQTGKPYSAQRLSNKKERPFDIIKIGLELPREELYSRINKRVDVMIEMGLVGEAERVFPERELNALNTVGYKELFRYFNNEISLDQAIEDIKTNTRRYAKRQLTWFSRDDTILWFPAGSADRIISLVERKLRGVDS
jgi:tRNA dimethylallyltransferase